MATPIPGFDFINYLELIVRGLVRNPAGVSVVFSEDVQGVLLTLGVSPRDMGRIIGKDGATAKALRAIMHTFGANLGAKVSVKILEPEGSNR
jgi:predicted RNA-binding protein YlqC (UPF0109 family)